MYNYIYQAKYEDLLRFDTLYYSALDAMKGVMWKPSVQNVFINLPIEIGALQLALANKSFKSPGFNHFVINERGKSRDINAVHIRERIVQKALCNYALKPAILPRLIYSNCASLKGKGTTFALNLLRNDLVDAYNKYGPDCYILIMDYHKYYDSIRHDVLLYQFRQWIEDDNIFQLFKYFVDMFACMTTGNRTIGYLDNTSIIGIRDNRPLDYDLDILSDEDYYINNPDIGLGLGSEISQIAAISYTNHIDHKIKEYYKMKYYTKYMDDSYIICNDRKKLEECYNYIIEESIKIGLTLNLDHSNFYKLSDYFYFLKKKIHMDKYTGKLIIELNPSTITKHRQLIHSHRKLINENKLSFIAVYNSFICWRESAKRFDSRNGLRELSIEFIKVFKDYLNIPEYKDLKYKLYKI